MKKIISIVCIVCAFIQFSQGQTTITATFATHDTTDKVYFSVLQAVAATSFVVKSSDKQQGIVQAEQGSGGFGSGQIFATIFLIVAKENGKSVVSATFTRNAGFMGGEKPEQMAQKFSNELGRTFPDLEIGMGNGSTGKKQATQHLLFPPTDQQMAQDLVGSTFGNWSVDAVEEVYKIERLQETQLADRIRYQVKVTFVKKKTGRDPRKTVEGYVIYVKDDKGLWTFSSFDPA